MKKKVITSSILAAFVATAMSGCQEEQTVESFNVKSASECVSSGAGSLEQCNSAMQQATEEHTKNAPKFLNDSECSTKTEAQCELTEVKNADGSSSYMFMPMMMGMIVGNMMNGGSNYSRPVYSDQYGRNFTSSGAYVSAGRGYTGSSTFSSSSSKSFSSPSTASKSMSSGGFGKSGSFGSTTG